MCLFETSGTKRYSVSPEVLIPLPGLAPDMATAQLGLGVVDEHGLYIGTQLYACVVICTKATRRPPPAALISLYRKTTCKICVWRSDGAIFRIARLHRQHTHFNLLTFNTKYTGKRRQWWLEKYPQIPWTPGTLRCSDRLLVDKIL